MTDCVRLYVFDCQNFVSEADHRRTLKALGEMAKAFNEDIGKAREAGRREGHLDALQALVTGLGMDINVRALLDSPKAEGEETNAD